MLAREDRTEGDAPSPSTTQGLASTEEWRRFFSRFPAIVLVANSDEVDLPAVRASQPAGALYVFFNKVYKVLDQPCDGESLLVARSGTTGANIVYRREVDSVLAFFPGQGFKGILNLASGSWEKLSPASDFKGAPIGHLELTGSFADFYPEDHLPSSGFALAVWLCELGLSARIVLAGFTARRSDRWKVFHIHDWTYEQVIQRVLARSGRLALWDSAIVSNYAAVTRRFPDIGGADVSLAAAEVLSQRLEASNMEIDKLISATRFGRSVDRFFRRLKPKTRKQKLAEKEAREKSGG
ncbi:MAG: 3-deoxy-manno-octulosonate cytidylyltransferase [Mesorhizobium sp.]